jgi:hypothetical protein
MSNIYADAANGRFVIVSDNSTRINTGAMQGARGPAGERGEPGPAGPGVAVGGTTGQILAKASGSDFDTAWVTRRLDNIDAPTAPVSLAGQRITELADPASAQDATTRVYSERLHQAALAQSASVFDTTPRNAALATTTVTSGIAYFHFFTPTYSITASSLSFTNGATVASGLTLARLGLYAVGADDTATLVARTASDTTLATTANTLYTRVFATAGGYPASYTLNAGTRYAVAIIFTGTTMPNLVISTGVLQLAGLPPRVAGTVTGLTDLPASRSTFANTSANVWMRIS